MQMPVADREPPKLGVRIITVTPEGQLERAGIQVMDLLSKYGKFAVVDYRKRKETLPKEYETLKLQTDAIEAFALSITGNETLAREIVARSTVKDRVEARLKNYWRIYPHGNKVVENWMRLAANK